MNIRSLANDTVRQIRAKQNWFTKKSRKDAINAFDDFLKADNLSNEDILTAAKLTLQVAKIDGYGNSGEQGSSFVRFMNEFIKKTELQIQQIRKVEEAAAAARKRDEKIQCERTFQNTVSILKKLSTKVSEDAFQELNKIRLSLEENVSNAITKHYPNTRTSFSWNRYVLDVKNDREIPSVSKPLFERIFKTKNLVLEVKNALHRYIKFLGENSEYLTTFRKNTINTENVDVKLNLPQYESDLLEVRPALNKPCDEENVAVSEYKSTYTRRR